MSFMGLPTANIFTGMQAIHSKHEWVGVFRYATSSASISLYGRNKLTLNINLKLYVVFITSGGC